MSFARLALRNLARNRRRTAATLAIVAAGTVALVLTAGFVRFSFDGLREAMIHGGLGHLEIASRAALETRGASALDRPLAEALADWRPLAERVAALPHVAAVEANLQVLGLAQGPNGASFSFVGVGVEPERERAMGFANRLRSGAELADAAPAAGEDGVLLAQGLASSLGVGVGDQVTLLASTANGMLNALDVRVTGILTTGVAELDTRFLKVHLATAARLLETDRVSNLLVGLDRTASTDAALAATRSLLADHAPPLAVTPWSERALFYDQVRGLYRGIFWFLGSIVFVLVVLAASNTLAMTVLERVRELGTLRAIGTGRGQLAAMILGEALWLGLLGGLAGCAAGWLLTLAINAAGIRMPPPPGAVDPIDLQLAEVPAAYGGALLLMTTVLALAALPPIWRAVRLSIVDALGHV